MKYTDPTTIERYLAITIYDAAQRALLEAAMHEEMPPLIFEVFLDKDGDPWPYRREGGHFFTSSIHLNLNDEEVRGLATGTLENVVEFVQSEEMVDDYLQDMENWNAIESDYLEGDG